MIHTKRGGIHFFRLGRLSVSLCWTGRKAMLQPLRLPKPSRLDGILRRPSDLEFALGSCLEETQMKD